jgi:hypothetical protein
VRACSYHAGPGACQANVLCISLWMIPVNMLVNGRAAVDGWGCGKVDNRRDIGSRQVAGLRLSTGGAKYPQVNCAVRAGAVLSDQPLPDPPGSTRRNTRQNFTSGTDFTRIWRPALSSSDPGCT